MNTTALRACVAKTGKSQKEIAERVFDWLCQASPDDKLKFVTVEGKLSKLLSDANALEGRSFFNEGRRREALATALDLPLEELSALLDGVQLLFDYRLAYEVTSRLKVQAAKLSPPIELIHLGADGARAEPRVALRDSSDQHPDAIVVLATTEDLSWFEDKKRGRRTATVKRVPRGYILEQYPDLLPVPPLAPPLAWGDGQPLVADPEVADALRRETKPRGLDAEGQARTRWVAPSWDGFGRDGADLRPTSEKTIFSHLSLGAFERLAKWLELAEAADREPSFPLSLFIARQGGVGDITFQMYRNPPKWSDPLPYQESSSQGPVVLSLSDVRWQPSPTVAWWFNEQIFALGPRADHVASLARGHHVECSPPVLAAWREALEKRNPFGNAFDELIKEAIATANIDLTTALAQWRQEVYGTPPVLHAQPGGTHRTEPPTSVDIDPTSEAEEAAARAEILALASRQMRLPLPLATLPLRLRVAAQAPLVFLPKRRFDVVSLLASLGAGHLLRIRIARFESAPERLVFTDNPGGSREPASSNPFDCVLDGGDVRVWIARQTEPDLEGT